MIDLMAGDAELRKRLMAFADHPLVGEARGMGLVGGLELSADKRSKTPFDPKKLVGAQVVKHAQDEGLIVRPIGDTISICPPLVIKPAEIDELFDKLEVAWRFKTDMLGPRPEYKLEGTPLAINGVLYATGGTRRDQAQGLIGEVADDFDAGHEGCTRQVREVRQRFRQSADDVERLGR